jgi:SAM-dependent methyltransferase
VPDEPEELLEARTQRIQNLQRELQRLKAKPVQGASEDTSSVRELGEEEQTRRRAEGSSKEQRNGAVVSEEIVEQTHALPQPDDSVKRRQIFQSLISRLETGRMLDLGAGGGNFSLPAAQLGWEVTAVDARTMRTPDAEKAKDPERAELIKAVRWVESDIREFPIRDGEYDLICILGLMHHLEIKDQIQLLEQCSGTLTLLDVRVAPEIVVTEGPYEGLYFQEGGQNQEQRARLPQASWDNATSFRHTEESLLRLLRECGYSMVMPMRPPHDLNYTFYFCLPSFDR